MTADAKPVPRKVYCVLSARSLPYATDAMRSLFAHCDEDLDLTLITDAADDKAALVEAMEGLPIAARHRWRVCDQAEADERAASAFAAYPNLSAFRFGHPCWRKITDPMLFAAPGEEMVILDPDLYFPNHFSFEPTPARGLLLMYQPPSCLLPHEVVIRAYDEGVRLAHHVDIGVAQLRNHVDLEWLDDLVRRLGGKSLPRAMHIEAVVWAALAMRMGGGYLDPARWHCWRNSQWKRVALKLGVAGTTLLKAEPFGDIKCFHGGGIAKWWVPQLLARGGMPGAAPAASSRDAQPFVELTRADYDATQRLKRWARRAGYYRLVGS